MNITDAPGRRIAVDASGTLNTTALNTQGPGVSGSGAYFLKSFSLLNMLDPADPYGYNRYWDALSGPDNFFAPGNDFLTGRLVSGTFGIGGGRGFRGRGPFLYTPYDYVSGDPISAESGFRGTVLYRGFLPGTYNYSWGSETDGTFDTLTLNIVSTIPAPAPGAIGILGLGAAAMMAARRRR